MVRNRNGPAGSTPKHSHGCQGYCAIHFFQHLGTLEKKSQKQSPDKCGQQDKPSYETRFSAALMFRLKCPDLFMDVSEGLRVHSPDNVGANDLATVNLNFKHCIN